MENRLAFIYVINSEQGTTNDEENEKSLENHLILNRIIIYFAHIFFFFGFEPATLSAF